MDALLNGNYGQKRLGSCHENMGKNINKEEKKAYNQEYNRREAHCEVCG